MIYEQDIATNYILEQYLGDEQITQESVVKATVGRGVTLKVGVDGAHDRTTIPQLLGRPFYLAREQLLNEGLNVGDIDIDQPLSVASSLWRWKPRRVYLLIVL